MMCTLIPIQSSCKTAIVSREYLGNSDQRHCNQRKAARTPSIQSALQRPNAPHAFVPQEQRHTGAGGFVWSSTVKNDVAVPRQTIILVFQLFRVHAKCARDGVRVSLKVHRMPQVHYYQFFARVDFLLQFVCGNAADAQLPQKSLARDELIRDVSAQGAANQNSQSTPQMKSMLRNSFDFSTENVSQSHISSGPEKSPQRMEKEESRRPHVENARQWRSHRAQSGHELRKHQ